MLDDDVSSHRTRTNRWPVPLTPPPRTIAEINDAMDDVIQDRN